jgi:hypothetical protein
MRLLGGIGVQSYSSPTPRELRLGATVGLGLYPVRDPRLMVAVAAVTSEVWYRDGSGSDNRTGLWIGSVNENGGLLTFQYTSKEFFPRRIALSDGKVYPSTDHDARMFESIVALARNNAVSRPVQHALRRIAPNRSAPSFEDLSRDYLTHVRWKRRDMSSYDAEKLHDIRLGEYNNWFKGAGYYALNERKDGVSTLFRH